MSKQLTKTDLKTLAKYIVEETKKYNDDDTNKRLQKEYKKKQDKLNKILQEEDAKNDFIDQFISDVMDQEDELFDMDYISDINKALFDKIEDLESIVNDMNKEAKDYTKKLYEKYSYIINQKLVNLGY
jgi:transcriptional regulator of heat shock response